MSLGKKISVLLADDHAVVRHGLCMLLEAEGHSEVVGQARNGREAVTMARTLRPDVILMDIAMPVLNGLEATRQILAANPAAKVLILSAHSDDEYVERMTAVGAAGFLEKQTSGEILTKAIREVAKGNLFFSPAIAKRMADGKKWLRGRDGLHLPNGVLLTPRETEVLQLVTDGQASKQVAATLGLSIKTVEKHRQRVMDKLNRHAPADRRRHAITQGLIKRSVQPKIV
jgi:DNA-binding NarL/FixJ family response regulator